MDSDLQHLEQNIFSFIPKEVLDICSVFRKNNHIAWVVGGSIRDVALGKKPHDWDLATTATPESILNIFPHTVPTGLQHGTVTVIINNVGFEITTLRSDGVSSDNRHPDHVTFITDIVEDLSRRDFTINAMAFNPLTRELIDPFHGLEDLKNKVVRAVGDPCKRFEEDGLRIMRAARFAAVLQFSVESSTLVAISGALESLMSVSKERIRDEWIKTLGSVKPSVGLEIMRVSGILKVVCPVLLSSVGCEQNHHHAWDVWKHTMECVDQTPVNKPLVRLAAVFHDVGKPQVRISNEKTGEWMFPAHDDVSADIANEWLVEHKLPNADREHVVHLVRNHLVLFDDSWSKSAIRRFVQRVGVENIEDLFDLVWADIRAKGVPTDKKEFDTKHAFERIQEVINEKPVLSTKQLVVDGTEVMERLGIKPGPLVGKILKTLLEKVKEEKINERNYSCSH